MQAFTKKQPVSREDWSQWMVEATRTLTQQSPSLALRPCSILANSHNLLAQNLFSAAFLSCWRILNERIQDSIIRSLMAAIKSPECPAEVAFVFCVLLFSFYLI